MNKHGNNKYNNTITVISSYCKKEIESSKNVNMNVPKLNKEIEFTPENYIIINTFKLTNNFKWVLFKKNKNKDSFPSKRYSTNMIIKRNKHYLNRNKSNDPRKMENMSNTEEYNINNYDNDSFSDFIWKPQKNRKDFLDFESVVDKNESIDKDKKIEEMEKNIKILEDKLEKKEKDFNRVNMTYAKLINRNKNPENNVDKLLDEIDKLKKENKNLNKNINKLKSEHNFIGLSFIADDLEASEFIDDKCFGDILTGLDKDNNCNNNKNKEKNSEKKEKDKDKEKLNINININNNNFFTEKKEKDNIISSYKTIKTDIISEKKEKENNDEKNKDNDKGKNSKPMYKYNRRFYRSIRGRENQEKKSENE